MLIDTNDVNGAPMPPLPDDLSPLEQQVVEGRRHGVRAEPDTTRVRQALVWALATLAVAAHTGLVREPV